MAVLKNAFIRGKAHLSRNTLIHFLKYSHVQIKAFKNITKRSGSEFDF